MSSSNASSSIPSRHLFDARCALARSELEIRCLRLALTLRHFNPSQPRVPAGHPDGGRWTSGGGSGGAEFDCEGSRPERPEIQPIGGFEREHLGMNVQDFTSRYCL